MHENRHSMLVYGSHCSMRENRHCTVCTRLLVAEESFFTRELLFAGDIVPSMRIVILCARVTSCRRIVVQTRIAV